MVTEPDAIEFREISTVEVENENESHTVSREDTMVEHSVVVNEEIKEIDEDCDYMAALQSMKVDQGVLGRDPALISGECEITKESGMLELG